MFEAVNNAGKVGTDENCTVHLMNVETTFIIINRF
jgi:hypothetical protein